MRNDAAPSLSPAESRDLQRLAGLMIPASAAFAIPGADDPVILADILNSLGRDFAAVRQGLTELTTLAGGSFADLDPATAEATAKAFWTSGSPALTGLGRAVLQCYYRDDRVVRSLGLEPRPPFPKGRTVEQGDWSLLDPVRSRPKFWRDDRGA